ncbi:MAG TPA: SPOR domain-containing protein [Steroidobacteraceae bacterium]|nr:SPOR domain-containing protein [Steroidobacteraceae bacterium]
MSAVTQQSVRDYKKREPRGLGFGRFRQFGAGLACGVLLCVVAYAYAHRSDRPAPPAPETPRPEAHEPPADAGTDPADVPAAGTDTGAAAGSGPQHYDFYSMLPNFEVVIPEKEHVVKRELPAAPIQRPGVYVLQAGSYRGEADSDRVARQLSLQGIDAKVQRVAVDNDVWYRVRVGPISDLGQVNEMRAKLRAADVDAIVIRVGD